MILMSHENNYYKLTLNGFFNAFNLEQGEIEDELTKELHEIINLGKEIETEEKSNENKDGNIRKQPFSINNLMLKGSTNDNSYVRI